MEKSRFQLWQRCYRHAISFHSSNVRRMAEVSQLSSIINQPCCKNQPCIVRLQAVMFVNNELIDWLIDWLINFDFLNTCIRFVTVMRRPQDEITRCDKSVTLLSFLLMSYYAVRVLTWNFILLFAIYICVYSGNWLFFNMVTGEVREFSAWPPREKRKCLHWNTERQHI